MLLEAKWPATSWVDGGGVKKWLGWSVNSHELGSREGCTWSQPHLLGSIAQGHRHCSEVNSKAVCQKLWFLESPGCQTWTPEVRWPTERQVGHIPGRQNGERFAGGAQLTFH